MHDCLNVGATTLPTSADRCRRCWPESPTLPSPPLRRPCQPPPAPPSFCVPVFCVQGGFPPIKILSFSAWEGGRASLAWRRLTLRVRRSELLPSSSRMRMSWSTPLRLFSSIATVSWSGFFNDSKSEFVMKCRIFLYDWVELWWMGRVIGRIDHGILCWIFWSGLLLESWRNCLFHLLVPQFI